MKELIIYQNDDSTFSACANTTDDEMAGLSGSLSDIWGRASELFITENDIINDKLVGFKFEELTYQTKEFRAEFDEDLGGYIVIFSDGKSANAMINEANEALIEKTGLSEAQSFMLDNFLSEVVYLRRKKDSEYLLECEKGFKDPEPEEKTEFSKGM